jgi:nucleoside-diphosphate-sugar epimerase
LQSYDSNTVGVENLIEVLKKQKQLELVLFASSMYVCRPGYKPKNEDDYTPHTVYGESKVLTEKIVKASKLDVPWIIFRPTSIWGPWFGEPYIDFFNIVLSRKFFHPGNRACKKTYGYIENTIHQIQSLIAAPRGEILNKVFYLGDWPAYDISEWADEIAAQRSIHIPRIPFFVFIMAGYLGDFLKKIGVKFPMTSFRLSNMTTDNVLDLKPIMEICPELPVSRQEGNVRTLRWMEGSKQ